jgi:hypothetical protein
MQQIREGFVGEFLEVPHAVSREQIEGVPRLLIELNALAGHGGILPGDNPATPWQFQERQASR